MLIFKEKRTIVSSGSNCLENKGGINVSIIIKITLKSIRKLVGANPNSYKKNESVIK
jgi:hypothetical protein